MIHNDIQNQLQLLIKTSAPPLIEVADHAVESPQWTPGQQIPAHVLASLPNGRFQVQVGDQILDLNLPRNTQPGESLELTYVSNNPRLTFALLKDVPLANPSLGGSTVNLSSAAKLIGNLIQPEPQIKPDLAQSPKTVSASVLSAPPVDVPAFAQALRTSVSHSGLFYESHQVQWLNGELNLAALKQEPQGQLLPLPQTRVNSDLPTQQPMQGNPATAGHEAKQAPNLLEHQPGQAVAQPRSELANRLPVEAVPHHSGQSPGDVHSENVHPQTVPLIQQQLQTLDTRQVIWQGEVWPGQQMHWEIEEEFDRQSRQQEGDAAIWHTRLNLHLPSLGGVNAKLAFVNGAVQLDIAAETEASAALMRKKQADLAERFAASGLQLSGVTIQHG